MTLQVELIPVVDVQAVVLASILVVRNRLEICWIPAWSNTMQRLAQFAEGAKIVQNLLKFWIASDFLQVIAKLIGQLQYDNRRRHFAGPLRHNESGDFLLSGTPPGLARQSGPFFVGDAMDGLIGLLHLGGTCTTA